MDDREFLSRERLRMIEGWAAREEFMQEALDRLEAAGKRIEGLEERLDWQIANGHKVNDDQQASLRAEVSMLRSQLRAAEDRADMRTAECAEEISALTNAIREWNLRAVEISKSRRRLVEYLLWNPSDSWDARPDTPAKREIEEILNEKV